MISLYRVFFRYIFFSRYIYVFLYIFQFIYETLNFDAFHSEISQFVYRKVMSDPNPEVYFYEFSMKNIRFHAIFDFSMRNLIIIVFY